MCTCTLLSVLEKNLWETPRRDWGQALEARCGGSVFVDVGLGRAAKWGMGERMVSSCAGLVAGEGVNLRNAGAVFQAQTRLGLAFLSQLR